MKHPTTNLDTDYTYCSGVTCPIRNTCRRYLPDPPDFPLWWAPPAYDAKNKQCPHCEPLLTPPNN